MKTLVHTSKDKFIVNGLSHSFHDRKEIQAVKVIDNINFSVKEHEFIAIVGPSGCGKSTLLNIMSGLMKPSEGEVQLDGENLSKISPRIGYISQSDTLLPWRTAIANVELGLELRKIDKKTRREKAMELIKQAKLSGFETSYPFQLSGGMRKRVDIIKVLALDPEIIFMDEPFAALDVFTREMLQNYILSLWEKSKRTIIFITHDLIEAITLADRVVILTKRPATIKAIHTIDLPRPRSANELRFNQQFIELHKRIWDDLKDEVEQVREL
ncbi:ABC transporter ATP-binding protein [Desulfuribacillus alkaliarsenatis]|uniref:ABC transporter ATP-binding protein n=1 Tax=Desulfuribacillus alkaliarsenatis TaxID=766136 RepID=A0A1E5G354_9FIRM|nr:ABC transporter ATP-binding protein [Desulfuribacillus alkaliarsenatis]OEF97414.1 ABC transporter ATP-binding protein [Desulfuribacillus alkaliarsenatis]